MKRPKISSSSSFVSNYLINTFLFLLTDLFVSNTVTRDLETFPGTDYLGRYTTGGY
nr:hypothetical protein [uncultured Bacteroides sp.]